MLEARVRASLSRAFGCGVYDSRVNADCSAEDGWVSKSTMNGVSACGILIGGSKRECGP